MKKAAVVILSALLISLFSVAGVMAGQTRGQHNDQKARIRQGIRSGELTRAESRILRSEQTRIERARRLAWADGRLTPAERYRLKRMRQLAGHDIYRLKHNHRHR